MCVKNRLQILNRLWKNEKNVRSPRGEDFFWLTLYVCRSFLAVNLLVSFIFTFDWIQRLQAQYNKKAQLSLTNPRDAKACPKLHQFDVLRTLSLTILVYLHSHGCCCVRNLRNPEKFSESSNLHSSRSSKVIDMGVNRKRICNFLLVINSNIGLFPTVFQILTHYLQNSLFFPLHHCLSPPSGKTPCTINIITGCALAQALC